MEFESVSFYRNHSRDTLNVTNEENVTEVPVKSSAGLLIGASGNNSYSFRNVTDATMKSELVSPRPVYEGDSLIETNLENVTEAPINLLTVLPTQSQPHDAGNVLNFTVFEELSGTYLEAESPAAHPAENIRDAFNVSDSEKLGNKTESEPAPVHQDSSYSTVILTDIEEVTEGPGKLTESPTARPAENTRGGLRPFIHTVNDTNAEDVTKGPVKLLTASPDADPNSGSFNGSKTFINATVKSESPTAHPPGNAADTLNVSDSEKHLSRRMKPESPTPHPAENTRDAFTVSNSEILSDTEIKLELLLLHQDATSNDTDTGNATEGPVRVLTAQLDADTKTDGFNGSRTIIQTSIKTESPTPHPAENTRDAFTVSDSEILSDTEIKLEPILLHQDATSNDTDTGNATEGPVRVLTAPLDADIKTETFNGSRTIIKTSIKTELPTPHPAENTRDAFTVSDSKKLLEKTVESAIHQDDIYVTSSVTKRNATEATITNSSYHLQTNNEISLTTNDKWIESECIIKSIKCSEKASEMQSTYGAWMSDASQLDDGRYWLAEHFSGRVLLEDLNLSSLQDTKNTIDIKRFYQGCGHVVYKGSFYFHNGGKNRLVKFGLNTRKTQLLTMPDTKYHNLTYLFRNSKTYFKFAVDENGLWVIFASNTDDSILVAKLNPDTFSIESVINTTYPAVKAGNAFIVCGVLYFTDDKDRRVTYAYDLKKKSPVDASFDLRPGNGILAMLSYYPNKKLLYMWDNRSVNTCRVKFKKT
ncbi:uncharacterized protein LOC115781480 isoform X2 [Archocentrus centrarchus]|uniref:uncharacterized protein LOC115781480 isoform X2 n=1 Tax=Archocentrus centrarchus TaxID=63155 RepID=UPI0011E9CD47|nr:uncharacterized protein LOC115781480 isoform X2 [Archocentrus centrarchus]